MYTGRQLYEIIWSQRLTEEVCTHYTMTNREQPNELQLDVYVRARMRTPVAMETVVCLPFSSIGEQVETADLLSEMMHWLAHWWGCQTNPRRHGPTTLTSCQIPGILSFFFSYWSRQRFFMNERTRTHKEGRDMLNRQTWLQWNCHLRYNERTLQSFLKQFQLRNERWFFFLALSEYIQLHVTTCE